MDQMDYEVDLLECLQILAKRKWLILTIIVISAVSAYVVSVNMTKIYDASSMIMIKSNPLLGSNSVLQQVILKIM